MPRPEGTPHDMLRFMAEPDPTYAVEFETRYDGPWPPPERLTVVTGPLLGSRLFAEPEVIAEHVEGRTADDVTFVTYERTAASDIPDDDDCAFLMRGATYHPVEA